MPRNMSFWLTVEQYKNKTKFVTRRLGWGFAKPGDIFNGVEKAQGLKAGEKMVILGQHVIVSSRWEPLNLMVLNPLYGYEECRLEGFPNLTPDEFVEMFCDANRCRPGEPVNRMAFEYL